jgi:hypothetical protein
MKIKRKHLALSAPPGQVNLLIPRLDLATNVIVSSRRLERQLIVKPWDIAIGDSRLRFEERQKLPLFRKRVHIC